MHILMLCAVANTIGYSILGIWCIAVFGVGFALSVQTTKAMRRPHKVEPANVESTLFLCSHSLKTSATNEKTT